MSIKRTLSAIMVGTCCLTTNAQEINLPVVQTKYTADPAPYVHNDTVYLYTTHDEDNSEGFNMKDWLLYTSTDMVNWQDHGAVASLKNFKWYKGDNGAWAEQVIERNGKWYMYCPIHGNGIGVLVADSPYGPFKDPLGKPLIWQHEHWNDIDPTVMIDDDGQAYMYWGNPDLYYVKLNEDMISYSGQIVKMPKIQDYQEGPWIYKRNGKYYLAFASTCCPEGIGYAMSKTPTGPWTHKGHIMDHTPRTRGNHPGIADFKGRTYIFGQNYDLKNIDILRHYERRSVTFTEMKYNPDGTIAELPYWLDQEPAEQLHTFNPYRRVEAETSNWAYGLKSAKVGFDNTGIVEKMPFSEGKKNMYIYNLDKDEYIRLRGVDFGAGAKRFTLSAAGTGTATITVRLDSPEGAVVGTVSVKSTGKVEKYRKFNTKVNGAQGVHDLYLCIDEAEGDVRLDWWKFE